MGAETFDIQRLGVDVLVMGNDWAGKFDHLKDLCDVVYLPRTPGISTTELRGHVVELTRNGASRSRPSRDERVPPRPMGRSLRSSRQRPCPRSNLNATGSPCSLVGTRGEVRR